METIKQILIRRDNLSSTEANELIFQAKEAFEEYMSEGNLFDAENICAEFFGLEPDYIDEFLDIDIDSI